MGTGGESFRGADRLIRRIADAVVDTLCAILIERWAQSIGTNARIETAARSVQGARTRGRSAAGPLPSPPRSCCATLRSRQSKWRGSGVSYLRCSGDNSLGPGSRSESLAQAPAIPSKLKLRYYYLIDWPKFCHWVRFVRAEGHCESCGQPRGHLGDGNRWVETDQI